jgi:hypothetical protein
MVSGKQTSHFMWAAGVTGLLFPPFLLGIPLVGNVAAPAAHSLTLPYWQQQLMFVTAFIIKPLYMALSLVIAFWVRHPRGPELTAIRRGMVCFFLGELACALNYLIFRDNSPLFEYWHNYGMVCAFALFASALIMLLDERIIHYSDPEKRCAMLSLCGGCYKQGQIRCTLLTLFSCLIPALAALGAIPLAAAVENRGIETVILGKPVLLGHPAVSQMMEGRFFPVMALCFLLPAFFVVIARREHGFAVSGVLVAMGLGPLLFSLMRFALYWGYAANPLWADVWEELTEFMFVLIILKIVLMVRLHQRRNHEISSAG